MYRKTIKDESGFLLAEILIAMIIFSIATIAAWKGIDSIITVQETNRQRNTALAIVTQIMDEEKSRYLMENYIPNVEEMNRSTGFTDGHGVEYQVETRFSKHNNPKESNYHNQLANIHVRITYPLHSPPNQRHTLDCSTLVNYRAFIKDIL